ncbi:MAG: SEC-C domain-containing protein [Candidatus Abyssobacteria bacterium SURF_5]|uniref:SEC-C domain-containing protein n=1 Tax=Abyssobacteria bacterium (strain SURF_5) TaxID=2093360 RepID=A0A3A4P3D0_ABYX5|nr:MAG: SEC-C domain-containing protein [Candidatus Abyssubacteria bacterium SURF_5]
MATVGRNEPCLCGSGKKYKKCCMAKDTSINLQEFRSARAEESLRNQILKFAMSARFKDEMVEAYSVYTSGKALLPKQDPLDNIRFLDWFIHEHVLSKESKPVMQLFGEVRGRYLDDDQKKLLDEWKQSRLGAFEVEKVEENVVSLIDVFTGQQHSIEDETAREEVKQGEVIVARMTSSWGKQKLGGAPIILAPEKKQKLMDEVNAAFEKHKEEHPDSDISQYLSTHAHVLSTAAADLHG